MDPGGYYPYHGPDGRRHVNTGVPYPSHPAQYPPHAGPPPFHHEQPWPVMQQDPDPAPIPAADEAQSGFDGHAARVLTLIDEDQPERHPHVDEDLFMARYAFSNSRRGSSASLDQMGPLWGHPPDADHFESLLRARAGPDTDLSSASRDTDALSIWSSSSSPELRRRRPLNASARPYVPNMIRESPEPEDASQPEDEDKNKDIEPAAAATPATMDSSAQPSQSSGGYEDSEGVKGEKQDREAGSPALASPTPIEPPAADEVETISPERSLSVSSLTRSDWRAHEPEVSDRRDEPLKASEASTSHVADMSQRHGGQTGERGRNKTGSQRRYAQADSSGSWRHSASPENTRKERRSRRAKSRPELPKSEGRSVHAGPLAEKSRRDSSPPSADPSTSRSAPSNRFAALDLEGTETGDFDEIDGDERGEEPDVGDTQSRSTRSNKSRKKRAARNTARRASAAREDESWFLQGSTETEQSQSASAGAAGSDRSDRYDAEHSAQSGALHADQQSQHVHPHGQGSASRRPTVRTCTCRPHDLTPEDMETIRTLGILADLITRDPDRADTSSVTFKSVETLHGSLSEAGKDICNMRKCAEFIEQSKATSEALDRLLPDV